MCIVALWKLNSLNTISSYGMTFARFILPKMVLLPWNWDDLLARTHNNGRNMLSKTAQRCDTHTHIYMTLHILDICPYLILYMYVDNFWVSDWILIYVIILPVQQPFGYIMLLYRFSLSEANIDQEVINFFFCSFCWSSMNNPSEAIGTFCVFFHFVSC